MYIGDSNIEVTTREMLVVIVFAILSLAVGCYVGSRMGIWQADHNAKYNQAVKIDKDSAQFIYAFETNAGNTLAYGDVVAVGSVRDNDLPGEYMSIHRVYEVYTMHTQLVCTGSGKTRSCHTRIYWTWDYKGATDWSVDYVRFNGKMFRFTEFPDLPSGRYIKTVKFAPKKRYVYYARDLTYTGTLFANIDDHVMHDAEYRDQVTIDQAIDAFSWKHAVLYFWVIFSAVIIIICAIFVALDNDWLNE